MKKFNRLITVIALVASFNTYSIEGAFEINQACVDTGCFPGDSAGFPVNITQSGNYILTSNLIVSVVDVGGIVFNTNNINLDLNGFSITGPTRCTGTPLTCSPSHTSGASNGYGINGTAITNGGNSIKNGTVTGFYFGFLTDINWRIDNVISEHNQRYGFQLRKGTVVNNTIARFNGFDGYSVSEQGKVLNSSAYNNGDAGIYVRNATTVDSNMVYSNGEGIRSEGRSLIARNTVYENTLFGIQIQNGGSQVIENRMFDNGDFGLELLGGTLFSATGLPNLLDGNTISNNNGGNAMSQIGGAGSFVETSVNLCGDNTTCP